MIDRLVKVAKVMVAGSGMWLAITLYRIRKEVVRRQKDADDKWREATDVSSESDAGMP